MTEPSTDSESPTAHSEDDRIIAKVNGSVVWGNWQTMQRFAKNILDEVDEHKTDLQKAAEINGAHIRVSCGYCDLEREFEDAHEVRNERWATPDEHADHPDLGCESGDVTVEAFCPRHGTIPLSYDECDGCADARNVMNR